MTINNTLHTQNSSNRQDYQQAYDNFSMDNLQQEIFGSQPDDGKNAYMACCGRHVRDGKGDKTALVHEDCHGNVRQLSFAELAQQSGQVANLLKSYGVQAGDRVATMLPRSPELLVIVLATWRIGAVYQPLFTAFGYESIDYRLQKANTKVVFTNPANREKFVELQQHGEIASLPKMVLVGATADENTWGDVLYQDEIASQNNECEPVRLDTDAPFLQMFTSGTVGKSKGVSVPLSALPAFYLYMRYAIDLQQNDKYWNMADSGWAYGLYYAITGPLLMGVTTYFNEAGFEAQNTFDFMARHGITNLASSPTAFRMMKSSGVFDGNSDKLALRVANSAGETLNTEVVGWVKDNLDCRV